MARILLFGIFFFAFFGNLLQGYHLIPAKLVVATEGLVYLLFLYSLVFGSARSKGLRVDLLILIISFVMIALFSAVANNMLNVRPIFSLRLVLRFYILYLAVINLGLSEKAIKQLNTMVIFFFLIQLPAVAYRFSYQGISEATIGTWDDYAGGPTAIIPIVALGYIAGFYAFQKKRFILWVLGIGFVLMGIVGAKAMLLFMYPIVFFGIYFLMYVKAKGVNVFRDISLLLSIAIVSVSLGAAIIKYQPRLNPERKKGGSIDVEYTFNYVKKYTTGMMPDNPKSASGRIATTLLVVKTLTKGGFETLFFGYGPGSLTRSTLSSGSIDRRVQYIAGSYGITGMSYILTEYGFIGFIPVALMFIIFSLRSLNWFKSEEDPYWKAIAAGTVVFVFYNSFIFFSYNIEAVVGDIIPPVFYYAVAVMYLRTKKMMAPELPVTQLRLSSDSCD